LAFVIIATVLVIAVIIGILVAVGFFACGCTQPAPSA